MTGCLDACLCVSPCLGHTCVWGQPPDYLWRGGHRAPLRAASHVFVQSRLELSGRWGSEPGFSSPPPALPHTQTPTPPCRGAPPLKTRVMSPFLTSSAVIACCYGHGGEAAKSRARATGLALWLVHSTVFPDTQTHTHTQGHTHSLEPSQSFSHRLMCPSKCPELPPPMLLVHGRCGALINCSSSGPWHHGWTAPACPRLYVQAPHLKVGPDSNPETCFHQCTWPRMHLWGEVH